jgi:hypothetical protein
VTCKEEHNYLEVQIHFLKVVNKQTRQQNIVQGSQNLEVQRRILKSLKITQF